MQKPYRPVRACKPLRFMLRHIGPKDLKATAKCYHSPVWIRRLYMNIIIMSIIIMNIMSMFFIPYCSTCTLNMNIGDTLNRWQWNWDRANGGERRGWEDMMPEFYCNTEYMCCWCGNEDVELIEPSMFHFWSPRYNILVMYCHLYVQGLVLV